MVAPADVLLGFFASLYRYARALSGNAADAEELVQETYRRALAARRTPAQGQPDELRPWLFTILRNIWHNEVRRRHHDVRLDPAFENATTMTADSPEAILHRKLLQSEIRAAIDALPEAFREVIVLREIENLSYAEIAVIVNCPTGTVMSRIARGRDQLRHLLARIAPTREVKR